MFLLLIYIGQVYSQFLENKLREHNRFSLMMSQTLSLDCYGVMFDAGSSGTRVYVYKWPCRQTQTLSQVNIEEIAPQKKYSPGIASYFDKLDQIEAYLNPFIIFAKQQIPENMIDFTPVMLGATAGMRLLTEEQQREIVLKIRLTFMKSGFLFMNPNWARVISGQEEGAYMWLSVNFLLGNLRSDIPPETAVTIDLGGASTQIAFIPEASWQQDTIDLTIPNLNKYQIYSITYLGYGNDQARITIISKSIDGQQNVINTPCYHNGYLAPWSDNDKYIINGQGNLDACIILIRDYLKDVNIHSQPPITKNIYAVNGVAVIGQLFNLQEFTLPQLYDQIKAFTDLNNDQVSQKYPDNPYIWTNYFMGVYVYELLLYGYRIPTDYTIKAPTLLNNNSPSWTLAATFYQVSQLDCHFDSPVCIAQQVFK